MASTKLGEINRNRIKECIEELKISKEYISIAKICKILKLSDSCVQRYKKLFPDQFVNDKSFLFKDLTNITFGYLTVDSLGGKYKNYDYFWNCTCKCGSSKQIRGSSLRAGYTKSCGCLVQEKITERQVLPNNLSAKNRIYTRYKNQASERNLIFDTLFDDFVMLIENQCHYCGIKDSNNQLNSTKKVNYTFNGVDRLDNTVGYTLKNCVTCCKNCNRAKMALSENEFIDLIKKIYKNYIIKNGYN